MRSHGRKICWEQLEEERRDSERLMSRLRRRGSFGELGPGDLEMLLLRLESKGSEISKAARKLLVQHISSLAPKGPVSRCILVLFTSQKSDTLPALWKLLTNPEQLPSMKCLTTMHPLHYQLEVELLRRKKL